MKNQYFGRRRQSAVRAVAWMQGCARVAIGAGMLLNPAQAVRSWSGEYDEKASSLPSRAFGMRDLVLGAGTLWSLHRGHPVRHWFILAVGLELIDSSVTVNKRRITGRAGPLDTWELLTASGLLGGILVGALLDE
ncbi:hypothetical protein DFR70_12132 [Nocardia tenerifensis]|uniref:VanZ like protein n=1 Tax=Nocardia tenerifensis TaxID=228006 RepID=A0A318JU59_9NOCA|nr:hypothetical protein [Nocardia tenerifensis]PXX55563.1 hypothetical protein DFR70_12132 [Nocardia tenerifensis]